MGRILGFFSLSHKAQTNGVKQTYKCKNYRVPFKYEIFNIFHKTLNFYLPHEFGGCGEPFLKDLYGLFNIYTPDMDLA